MSLLDCICCARHGARSAVVWDDLETCQVWTLSFFLGKSCRTSCYLRQLLRSSFTSPSQPHSGSNNTCTGACGGPGRRSNSVDTYYTVGLYGRLCPEVLSAMLGVLAVPATYLPVDLSQPEQQRRCVLQAHGVGLVLVQFGFLNVINILERERKKKLKGES